MATKWEKETVNWSRRYWMIYDQIQNLAMPKYKNGTRDSSRIVRTVNSGGIKTDISQNKSCYRDWSIVPIFCGSDVHAIAILQSNLNNSRTRWFLNIAAISLILSTKKFVILVALTSKKEWTSLIVYFDFASGLKL